MDYLSERKLQDQRTVRKGLERIRFDPITFYANQQKIDITLNVLRKFMEEYEKNCSTQNFTLTTNESATKVSIDSTCLHSNK